MSKTKILIGFDADVHKTGVSVLRIEKGIAEFVFVGNIELRELDKFIDKYIEKETELEARIESAGEQPATFGAYGHFIKLREAYRRKRFNNPEAAAFSNAVKRVEQTGRNGEVANQIIKTLVARKIKHAIIKPSERQRFNDGVLATIGSEEIRETILAKKRRNQFVLMSKLDKIRFSQLTEWTKRTNEDSRDAALLLLPDFIYTNFKG